MDTLILNPTDFGPWADRVIVDQIGEVHRRTLGWGIRARGESFRSNLCRTLARLLLSICLLCQNPAAARDPTDIGEIPCGKKTVGRQ